MLTYSVLGNGVWGKRVVDILRGMGRKVHPIYFSYKSLVGKGEYLEYLSENLKKAKISSDILWVAIPPNDQFSICELATDIGFHQIYEKPWNVVSEQANRLHESALKRNLTVGVHFQYCYLDRLKFIADIISSQDSSTEFSGIFNISRINRLNIDPMDNLGVHLVAIKMLHFKSSTITSIKSSYNEADERKLSLTNKDGGIIEMLDFNHCAEPIIQRYIEAFENSIEMCESFQLDIDFARKVSLELSSIKKNVQI